MKIESAVISHVGKIRKNNEDNYFLNGSYCDDVTQAIRKKTLEQDGENFIFAVCDGMGGEEYGELASLSSVIALCILKEQPWSQQALKVYLEHVSKEMKNNIPQTESETSGAAIVILAIEGKKAYIANLGDCRLYLYREGILKKITVDHTQAQYLVDTGVLTEEEARKHRSGHVLTRCLCLEVEITPEDFYIPKPIIIQKNDIFLLCSDGLTDMLTEKQIGKCLDEMQREPSKQITEQLVQKALEAGGRDNVTCMLIKADSFNDNTPKKEKHLSGTDNIKKKSSKTWGIVLFVGMAVCVIAGICNMINHNMGHAITEELIREKEDSLSEFGKEVVQGDIPDIQETESETIDQERGNRKENIQKDKEEDTQKDFEIVKGVLHKYIGSNKIVQIPYSVTKIDDYAFGQQDIESIEIPPSVTKIGKRAFDACENLSKITIPDSVKKIKGSKVFPKNCTIYCKQDSYAMKYAKKHQIQYAIIEE